MATILTFQLPVYIDWVDQQNQRHLTSGQQLDTAIHELLLSQSPWTDEWYTEIPYTTSRQKGVAKLAAVTADHDHHRAILTIRYEQPTLTGPDNRQLTGVVAIFLKTVMNRFCQRTTFGVNEARLAVRIA